MSRAFSASDFSKADAPLRMPVRATVRSDLRIQAGRQLRASLWLMAVLAIAFSATLLARPSAAPSLSAFSGVTQLGAQTASASIPSLVEDSR